MFIFENFKITKFIFFSFLIGNFLSQTVISNEKSAKDNLDNWEKLNKSNGSEKIKWEKLEKIYAGKKIQPEKLNKSNGSEKIKWEKLDQDSIPKSKFNLNESGKLSFQERENLAKPKKNSSLYSGPFVFSNSFLEEGYFSHDLKQKSSFSGGDAKGSGNQNYSYALNYALRDDFIISGIISEADDPLYNSIKNKPQKNNFWRNYALVLNKKLFTNKKNNLDFSFNSSLEYWKIESYYKKIDNSIVYGDDSKLLGSISFPLTKNYKNLNFSISPRVTFLPDNFGSSVNYKNFYGNNYSFSTGLGIDLFTNTTFEATYTFLYGNSKNTYDNNLNFSRNNIYSYGINWVPNSVVNLNLGLTNSFGMTPATSLLTIPSANLDLYTFKITFRPEHRDTIKIPIALEQIYLYKNGLTVNNALIPRRGSNQLFAAYDGTKGLFGYYAYSISNIFQIEFANLANIKDNKIQNNTKANEKLKNTFFSEGNFNNRFGGTLNILSPDKKDPFWMSLRTTIGRDQKSVQGYLYSEILNTFQLNNKLTLNISPKYAWSGIKSTGGAGLSIVYKINERFSFSPEMNFNFRDSKDNNNALVLNYFINEEKSIDFFVTNALGIQDMSQLIKSKDNKIGIRLNLLL